MPIARGPSNAELATAGADDDLRDLLAPGELDQGADEVLVVDRGASSRTPVRSAS